MTGPDPALAKAKAEMRAWALKARAGCDPAWGVRLAGHVLNCCPPLPGEVVAGFWPLPGEIDVRPLLLALAGRGHTLCLPATPPRGQALIFRRWQPGDRLLPERFGTVRPEGEVIIPDLVLVPLLAFDRKGHRLGYGGGFYDRTLATLPGRRTMGCAFAVQEVAKVPAGAVDRPIDAVATQEGVVRVARAVDGSLRG